MGLNVQMALKKNVLIIRLKGELDQSSVTNLKYRVSEIIDKYHIKNLVINMQEVAFMDSSGIGFIIGRYSQIKKRKGHIVICSMNEMVQRIFNLSGLKKICFVTKNEIEAEERLEIA
ncbi:MAG: anti-sigma factor antagonist [Bacilli bacterium]|nr:anti-sigma factor antagonist [Bacilli bacterium]